MSRQLTAPLDAKHNDSVAEQVRRSHAQAIKELQDYARELEARLKKLGG